MEREAGTTDLHILFIHLCMSEATRVHHTERGGGMTRVNKLGSKCLHLLSHPSSPWNPGFSMTQQMCYIFILSLQEADAAPQRLTSDLSERGWLCRCSIASLAELLSAC